METILFIIVAMYCIFLNLRIKDLEVDVDYCVEQADIQELKVYNKMMEIRKEIKESIKVKKVAKRRGTVTKKRSKLS